MTEKQFYKKGGTGNLQTRWKRGNKRRPRALGEVAREPDGRVRWEAVLQDRKEFTRQKKGESASRHIYGGAGADDTSAGQLCPGANGLQTSQVKLPDFPSSRSRRLRMPKARPSSPPGSITNGYPFLPVRPASDRFCVTATDTAGNGCWLYIQIFPVVFSKVRRDHVGR